MPLLGRFARALRGRLWKPSVEQEVRLEIEHHLDRLEREFLAQGMDRDAARAAARQRFGDAERVDAECRAIGERRDREMMHGEWMMELQQDVRYAFRQIRVHPRFTLVAVLTLAVGLGAMTTIFGIANAVLLRPLPGVETDRLLILSEVNPRGGRFSVSEPNYLDWRARTRMFEELAAFSGREPTLRVESGPLRLVGAAVTHTFFGVLGVSPVIGRAFTAEEDVDGGDTRVLVLSYALWQGQFGGDPGILSRVVDLDGDTWRVIGVMPEGFDFPGDVEVWMPATPSYDYHRGDRRLSVLGRLAPGVSPEQAGNELRAIASQLAVTYPNDNGEWTAQVLPFSEWFVSPRLERRVSVLLAAVGLLLVLACVNVASLLLARASTRRREIAVRVALGAGRGRLVRQLLTESIVLSVVSAAIGLALAAWAIPIVRNVGAVAIPRLAELTLDWRVVTFALSACLSTGILFGLAPALRLAAGGRASGNSPEDALRSGARTVGSGRVRDGLVIASVAIAMLLLVSAGLVGGSFLRLMRVDLGFEPSGVLTGSIVVPLGDSDEEARAATILNFYGELTRRLEALPGVRSVGMVNIAPFSGGSTAMGFEPAHWAPRPTGEYQMADWRLMTPGTFAALGIPLIKGRLFTDADRDSAPRVMVINETMARIGWPDADPIGGQVRLASGLAMTVVGVAGDTRHVFADSVPPPTMYFPYGQFPWRLGWVVVRTQGEGDPAALLPMVRAQLAAVDPGVPLSAAQPLSNLVRETTAEPRLTLLVFAIFGMAALVLAAIGLYGLLSYSVTQRTTEIGVRMALGSSRARIVGSVLAQGLRLAALGVLLGGVLAFGAVGALRAILYETDPTDPATFAGIGGLLLLVAALATVIPARRAARLDPLGALRSE